ncbi:MAG: PSD1 and planctomycete cytochrome C domain-containing protein, partial [Planctomycetota bacterium]
MPSARLVFLAAAPLACTAALAAPPDFDREVRPILAAKCYACHGPDAESRKAGLRLDTFAGATAMHADGVRGIVAGDPEASAVLARVAHADPDERMPPVGEPLAAAEVDILRRWIEAGAQYTEPWAFTAMRDAQPPAVHDHAWCRSDIDRFVLATRERVGLAAPARDAAPESLVRRVSFDLRGLPPDEADVRAFAADPSDAAFAALVDRYLADPAFGERLGRHWLDLARYAESLAHEFDYDIPNAWRYRDYVIDAFNADLPPARFVAEQLMGDLMPPRAALGLPNAAPIGTAWWHLGPATHAPVDPRQDEADRIALTVDVAGRSLFGLSVACARCHDHKFDPIPATDFFALAGVARNTRRVEGFLDSDPRASGAARELWSALAEAVRAAPAAEAAVLSPDAALIDAARDGGAAWTRSGHAFAAAGESAALAADGTLRAAESGTIDSARGDAALVGSARSPAFTIAKRYLHVRLRGHDAWIRNIIDNYWLDDQNALLFEGMRRRLGGIDAAQAARDPREFEWRAETFDLSRFLGERAYIELIDDGAGWIEVDAIVASDSPAPPAGAWDSDVPLALRESAEPLRARAVAARDALRACAPPVRALVADEGGSHDEPLHVRGASRSYGEPVPRARLAILGSGRAAGDGEPAGVSVEGVSVEGSRLAGSSLGGSSFERGSFEGSSVEESSFEESSFEGSSFEGSGRLQLVEALTDPARPFLWRTTANRVWLKLFGRGIVETPDDFGQLGAAPWSPELLDHLALKLARGATFKSLIREIVMTRAYHAAPEAAECPPAAWSPLPVRRLDAEAIRDAMLAASGRIDRTMGGPSVPVHLTEHMQGRGRPGASGPVDGAGRRSVYIAVRRNFLDQFMQAF